MTTSSIEQPARVSFCEAAPQVKQGFLSSPLLLSSLFLFRSSFSFATEWSRPRLSDAHQDPGTRVGDTDICTGHLASILGQMRGSFSGTPRACAPFAGPPPSSSARFVILLFAL